VLIHLPVGKPPADEHGRAAAACLDRAVPLGVVRLGYCQSHALIGVSGAHHAGLVGEDHGLDPCHERLASSAHDLDAPTWHASTCPPRAASTGRSSRPGRLTDGPGTDRTSAGEEVGYGEIPRDDLAATLVAVLDTGGTLGKAVDVVGGEARSRTPCAPSEGQSVRTISTSQGA
jgi:hypothetical protein